jgi:hypothetical protein
MNGCGAAVLNAEYRRSVSPAVRAVSVTVPSTLVPAVGFVTKESVPIAVVPFLRVHVDVPPLPVASQVMFHSVTTIGCIAVKIPASGTNVAAARVPIEQRENENTFFEP